MLIQEVMAAEPVTVSPQETVAVAARVLARSNVGCLPVCTGDRQLRGVLTDRDIVLRSVASNEDAGQQQVREIMTRRLVTVGPEEPLSAAARLMAQEQVRRLPVTKNGKLVGMISLRDLAHTPEASSTAADTLREISSGIRRSTAEG